VAEVEVEDDQVGRGLGAELGQRCPYAGNLDAWAQVEDVLQAAPGDGMVVDDSDADD
jgi:hypothetical protein